MRIPRVSRLMTIAALALVVSSGQVADAQSLRDRIRDKAREAKRKWDDSERSCEGCGKKIHGRSRCASCVAKRGLDKASKAKKKWQDSARACKNCGKKIHGRNTCTTCIAKRGASKAREAKRKAGEAWRDTSDERDKLKLGIGKKARTVRDRWRESADERQQLAQRIREGASTTQSFARQLQSEYRSRRPEIQAACNHAREWAREHHAALGRRYRIARDVYGPRVLAEVRDPQNQKDVLETLGALHSAHLQFKRMRYEATYQGLKLAGQIPVQTWEGRLTLEELARRRMTEKLPALRGTPLADDPAAPLTHLLTGDRSYFFDEMPLVESRGRKVSLKDAMMEASPFDTSKAMKILAVYEAADDVAHTIDTGEGTLEAIGSTFSAVEAVSKN